MLYPAALTSALLSPATLALAYVVGSPATGARLELGELAEALLGAAEPVLEGAKAAQAARIIALEMNHLTGLGVATEDVSALIRQSETRGARSHTNQQGVPLVPPALQAQFDALDGEPGPPPPATATLDPARFLAVRSLR